MDLADAFDGVTAELAPVIPERLVAEIGAIVGLLGGDWSNSRREEFIGLVAMELEEMPGVLVLDALKRARRRVTAGRLLLPWVVEDVERKAAPLQVERDTISKLIELAA